MSKLSLESFKAKMSEEDKKSTNELIGGILGDCHCVTEWNYEDNNATTKCE